MVSELCDLHMGYFTSLRHQSASFFKGVIPQKKIKKAAISIMRTKLRNILTYFVNIHAHPSMKHAMRNSRTTVSKNGETTQYFISVFC